MNRTVRIQSAAGAATIVALPLLYIGGVHEIVPVTAIGFAIFTVGMLTTPALRFLPQRTEQEGQQRVAEAEPATRVSEVAPPETAPEARESRQEG